MRIALVEHRLEYGNRMLQCTFEQLSPEAKPSTMDAQVQEWDVRWMRLSRRAAWVIRAQLST